MDWIIQDSQSILSPKWWKDYQKLKHNRTLNHRLGTLNNAFCSLAGLFILLRLFVVDHADTIIIPSTKYLMLKDRH
jgi:hypothetical protein